MHRRIDLIAALPQGYEWRFVDVEDSCTLLGVAPDKPAKAYRIHDNKLVEIKLNLELDYAMRVTT